MKRLLIGGLLAAVSSIGITAQNTSQSSTISPYSQYGFGILADQSQAFSRGMNGVGLALRNGMLVNTLNPASYSAVDSLTMLFDMGLSGRFTNFKEAGVSVNTRSASFDYAVGLFRMRRNLGVSFGLLPYSDVGYSYTTSTYLNSSIGSISELHSGSGGLHQAFVGVGWRPLKPLSIGFNIAYLWGTYKRSVSSVGTSIVNSLSKSYEASVSNYLLDFGLQWQQPLSRTERLTLGATVGVGHKLNADPTCSIVNTNSLTSLPDTTLLTAHNALELPMSYGVGLAWTHADKLTVAADVTLQKWGSVSYPSYEEHTNSYASRSNLFTDRTRYGVGLDYVPNPLDQRSYLKHVHYRLGASYTTSYYKVNGVDGPSELSVSAGLGIPLLRSRSELNLSAQWVHSSADGLITDNTFRVSVGLTFNERWFAKFRIE